MTSPTSPTTVRAKFVCGTKVPNGDTTTVHLYAVYSNAPDSENKAFSDATPAGTLQLTIQNAKPALAAFDYGKYYYIDITPAD